MILITSNNAAILRIFATRRCKLQAATRQLMALYPETRLMCLSVVRSNMAGPVPMSWIRRPGCTSNPRAAPAIGRAAGMPPSRLSLHVIEGADPGGMVLGRMAVRIETGYNSPSSRP